MQHTQSAINIHAHAIFTNAMFWLNGEKCFKTKQQKVPAIRNATRMLKQLRSSLQLRQSGSRDSLP
jgi:hypothetical protein